MLNTTSNVPSLSDIAAVTNNSDAFGGNNGWWILILLFAIFGGWGNGYGANNTPATTSNSGAAENYVLASDFATLQRQIDTAADGLRQQSTAIANGLCDGFYTQAQLVNGVNNNIATSTSSVLSQMNNNAINAMQDNFAIQTAINGVNVNNNTNTQALLGQLATNEANRQACCCENRYQMAEQACQTRQAVSDASAAITANNDANTRSILTAIQDMQTSALQDKIATLTAEKQALQFAASQQAQNAYLVNQLKATPVPAYTVPNPYTGTYGYSSCSGCAS